MVSSASALSCKVQGRKGRSKAQKCSKLPDRNLPYYHIRNLFITLIPCDPINNVTFSLSLKVIADFTKV